MPSRILPDTSTASTPHRDPSSTSRSASDRSPRTSPHDKSDTRLAPGQSSLAHPTDHLSATAPSQYPPAAISLAETGITGLPIPIPDTRQRTRSPPSPSHAVRSPLLPLTGSYFVPQPGASGAEARSPLNKRPPASRSSNGVETFSGPPPALSTQRSYQGDSAGRHTVSVDRTQSGSLETTVNSIDALIRSSQPGADGTVDSDPVRVALTKRPHPMHVMDRTALTSNGNHADEDHDENTLKGADFPQLPFASAHKNRHENGELKASQEDLFLNLAHADSPRENGAGNANHKAKRHVRKYVR